MGGREKRSIRYGESISPRLVERDSSPSSILRERKTRIRVLGDGFSDPLRAGSSAAKYRVGGSARYGGGALRVRRESGAISRKFSGGSSFNIEEGTNDGTKGFGKRSIYLLT